MKITALAFSIPMLLAGCREHATRAVQTTRAVTVDPCATDADCLAGFVCTAGVCALAVDASMSDAGRGVVRIGPVLPPNTDSSVGAEISDVTRSCHCEASLGHQRGGPWLIGIALVCGMRRRRRVA